MHSFFQFVKKTYTFLILTSLLASLVACGTGHPATVAKQPYKTAASAIATSAATTGSLIDLLAPNRDNVASDTGGLHIQESSALHCLNLVLASDRLTYDQGEIQQMSQFLKYSEGVFQPADLHRVPATLRWLEGGYVGHGSDCSATFQITNTGNATIQISRVALRIKKTPLPNTFVYRLINMCSFLPPGSVCGGRGGMPGPCGIYYVSLSLNNAKLNDAIGDKPTAGSDASGNPCPELTLAPQKSAELVIGVGGPAFIYSVIPEFSVTTSQGHQVLALSAFASTVAFSTQFPCYTLQGNSLVLMKDSSNSFCV